MTSGLISAWAEEPRNGDRVRVKAGSLAGRAGTVTWVNAKRVELEAMLFGRMRQVIVKREDVKAA